MNSSGTAGSALPPVIPEQQRNSASHSSRRAAEQAHGAVFGLTAPSRSAVVLITACKLVLQVRCKTASQLPSSNMAIASVAPEVPAPPHLSKILLATIICVDKSSQCSILESLEDIVSAQAAERKNQCRNRPLLHHPKDSYGHECTESG